MANLKVRDLMTEEVFSISAQEDLIKLNDLMEDIHSRHVPVVDEDGNVVGLVSQRDLTRSALDLEGNLPEAQQRELLKSMRVEEVMTVEPQTAEPDQNLAEAARIMLDNKLGCLPVVENEHLVGILTEADFVKYVAEQEEA